MKITISQLRRIIREEIEKDAEKMVGKYLWPAERGLNVNEPNTTYEDELFDALSNSIAMNQQPLTMRQVQDLFFLADTGKYSDVLKKKNKGKVYRGVNVTREWFKSSFGISFSELTQDESKTLGRNDLLLKIPDSAVAGTVWGKEGVPSSWTTDIENTKEFAMGMAGTGKAHATLKLILVADCNTGNFLDYKPFYSMRKSRGFNLHSKRSGEAEVIALGQVPISEAFLLANDFALATSGKVEDTYTYQDPETKQVKWMKGTREEIADFQDKEFVKSYGGKKFDPLSRIKT